MMISTLFLIRKDCLVSTDPSINILPYFAIGGRERRVVFLALRDLSLDSGDFK